MEGEAVVGGGKMVERLNQPSMDGLISGVSGGRPE